MRNARSHLASTPVRVVRAICAALVVSVSVAVMQASGVVASGTAQAFAWGNNQTGELDDGTTVNRNVPVAMVGLDNVATLAVGAVHGLGLRADGTVIAWGHNRSGQLGDGSTTDHSTPVPVAGVSGAVAVSAGTAHSMALLANGTVLGWGNNNSGEVGDGSTVDRATAVGVSGLGAGSGVVAIAAGRSHCLALKSDGTVLAWGNNQSGQLGDGSAPTDHPTPVQVSGLGPGSGVVKLAAGGAFGLALKADGTVLAWGNNQSGQLGDGSAPTDQHTPVATKGLPRIVDIATGGAHSVALAADGTVFAWGFNNLGQVGDGTTTARSTPVAVSGLGTASNVVAVFAAGDHSHALVASPSTAPRPIVPGSRASRSPTARAVDGNPTMTG